MPICSEIVHTETPREFYAQKFVALLKEHGYSGKIPAYDAEATYIIETFTREARIVFKVEKFRGVVIWEINLPYSVIRETKKHKQSSTIK